jgi:arylsulfatase A-like enzyme
MRGLAPVHGALAAPEPSSDALARARRAHRARHAAPGLDGLPSSPGAHILLVTVDALRADHLGAYGYDRGTTPHMDTLAERSIVFERGYTPAPHSSYSLCSLMTSEYLHETAKTGSPLPEETLVTAARDVGFYTAAFYTNGIFHTAGEHLHPYRDGAFGFDLHEHANMDAEASTDRVLREVDRIAAAGEPPSLLWVHYFDVHEPYRERSLGDSAVDRYDGEIRNVDRAVGRLVREADERLEREVIVVLTADHGEEFRDHGGLYHGSSLYDEQVRVPLFVRAPDLDPGRVQTQVSTVDLAPTLLGLMGAPPPRSMRGRDLRALMTGRVDTVGPAFAGVAHQRMAVRWPHKLVTDLRHDLVELYDLAADPRERVNLADRLPDTVEALRGEVHAWLDSLRQPPGIHTKPSSEELALARGRSGDRRAVAPLSTLVLDDGAPAASRAEAARLLGRLEDPSVRGPLAEALHAPHPEVATEAAIALGNLGDDRARASLRALVRHADGDVRTRAGLALGELRDPAALPGLLEAARGARTRADRRHAVYLLGRIGDPRAVDALVDLLAELPLRRVAIDALGHIGDPRAHAPLLDLLDREHRPHLRDHLARALAESGAHHALGRLTRMAAHEPELQEVGEALVRLNAIPRGVIGGVALGPGTADGSGLGPCHREPAWRTFAGATWCTTDAGTVTLPLAASATVRRAPGVVAMVRLRRAEGDDPVQVGIRLGHAPEARVQVGDRWIDHRLRLRPADLGSSDLDVVIAPIDSRARLHIDHVLLIPRQEDTDGDGTLSMAHPSPSARARASTMLSSMEQ